jgi:hypothetical protein
MEDDNKIRWWSILDFMYLMVYITSRWGNTLNLWDQRGHVGAKLNKWRAARQIDSHCDGSHVDLTTAIIVATRRIYHVGDKSHSTRFKEEIQKSNKVQTDKNNDQIRIMIISEV